MADINPTSMATQLATAYTQNLQSLITTQTKTTQNTATALTKLQSALRTFDTALSTLSGKGGLQPYSATFSATGYATASATSTAQAGTYNLFVEQVATAHQIAFDKLPAVPVSTGGPIKINLADGSSINVNLSAADQDGDGTLSQAEIARSINQAADNGGKLTAMIVTVGGSTQLVMTAGKTGASNAVASVDASGLPAGALKDALSVAPTQLVAAQDAIVWLGAQGSGIKLQQASNTFTAISGVTLTVTQAMKTGDSPLALTVARDDAGAVNNVQSFIDAYNTLNKTLDELTDTGNAATGQAASVFASDSGVRSLRSRLTSLIRQDFGGLTLMNLGVSADRNGVLSLKASKLSSVLSTNPTALDQVFGKTGLTTGSGLLGATDSYMDVWLNSATGHVKNRQNTVQKAQAALTTRQTRLDGLYQSYYDRYLKQFSQLQSLQSHMSETSSLFNSLPTS